MNDTNSPEKPNCSILRFPFVPRPAPEPGATRLETRIGRFRKTEAEIEELAKTIRDGGSERETPRLNRFKLVVPGEIDVVRAALESSRATILALMSHAPASQRERIFDTLEISNRAAEILRDATPAGSTADAD